MLVLPIKKKWFDMILSGEKKEEYREITPYYKTRFCNWFGIIVRKDKSIVKPCEGNQPVMFRNGYNNNSPSFVAMCSVKVGTGKEEWGAEKDKQYFVLAIHEIERGGIGMKANELANIITELIIEEKETVVKAIKEDDHALLRDTLYEDFVSMMEG